MHIIAPCRGCDARLPVSAREAPGAIQCGRCGASVPLAISAAVREDREVDQCPVCGGDEFYVRKDFNPRLGVAVVAAGALVSAVFYWFDRDLVAYGVLALAVMVDVIIYGRLGDVTVCYRCHAEFRGAYRRTAAAFDLHTADRLEPEYERRIGRR